MPPVNPSPFDASFLKELAALQSAMYDKATAYTKVIVGLGYGGFFVAWSGTKEHLSPKLLVSSALLMTFSLVLYLVFEIFQTMIFSHLSIKFANAANKTGADLVGALGTYKSKLSRWNARLGVIWYVVFSTSALTGLGGAGILISAFVTRLLRM